MLEQTKKPKSVAGFTLLEMIMVIAVLGILLAILTAPLVNARRHAMLAKCQANLRSVYGANMDYMTNNNGHKPEIAYDIQDGGVVIIYFAGTTTKFDGEPVGQGKVMEYLGGGIDTLLCPAVTVPGDTETDQDDWENSDRAGSSYLYEWYHPPELRGTFSPWPKAFEDFLESVRFSNRPVSDALLLDFNFERVPGTTQSYLSHKYLKRVNVLHNDGSVKGYHWNDGLYGYQWGVQGVLDMMDNAHHLRYTERP